MGRIFKEYKLYNPVFYIDQDQLVWFCSIQLERSDLVSLSYVFIEMSYMNMERQRFTEWFIT